MKTLLMALCVVALGLATAGPLCAEGPHDMDCMECHTTHYAKGDYAIGVQPLTDMANPARTSTRPNAENIDAICLGCHNDNEGILPVNLHTTHPTGVKPTYTTVPANLLWEGVFTCTSCHNPHPSNANYAYLVVDTAGGKNMGTFCAKCHPGQSDPATVVDANGQPIFADPNVPPVVRVMSK